MSEEQVTSEKKEESIGPVEAYHILLQRQISEDRIIVERTSIFLAASSFLFLAFVMLLNPALAPIFKVLRIALPILGLFLTFLLCHLNLSSDNALGFWHRAQRIIEDAASEFAYMRGNEITPHYHGGQAISGRKKWERTSEGKWLFRPVKGWREVLSKLLRWLGINRIYWLYLPGGFCILWLAALIVAIIN